VNSDATAMEEFVRSDLFRAILRTQHADLLERPAEQANTVPTGAVVPYAIETAPEGWLVCNGQDVYKDAYPALFGVLSTKYGTPSDTLKFRLPDLQGRVPVGYGTGYTTLNAPAGSKDAVLVSHNHGGATGSMNRNNPHNHTASDHDILRVYGAAGSEQGMLYESRASRDWVTGFINGHSINNQDINHEHSITTEGVSGTDKNMQPYIVLNYIIRT
jgi:microcystin-dependent protein